ncbi:MAG TPA: hypothetical protein VHZ73_13905 [Vicinamibacterales bacterium]|nr:hypothetical protein [Vicinamibacterales bacterium]
MYTRRTTALLGLVAFTLFAGGCVGASKSADPLAPTVAGPLPGVNINAPNPTTPVGTRVAMDAQPVTLTVTNAGTNSQRTVTYLFEVATDSGFANKVFTRDGVAPSATGQTSLKLPDPLATGHTYYWRAKAGDGANSSDYSNIASFDVYTPVVINPPTLVSPVGNAVTDTVSPTFVIADSAKTGPASTITYVVEIADSQTFANRLAIWTIGETAGQTSLPAPGALPANAQIYWRVHASDSNNNLSAYSAVAVFKTPNVVIAPPQTGGGGSGGGGTGGGNFRSLDQLNLSAAHISSGATDVANWSVTTNIQSVTIAPSGINIVFPAQGSWPDQIPPGFAGPLQYTVWACVQVNGWTCSGIIQMWRGRGPDALPPLPSQWPLWWGASAGGAINFPFGGYQAQPGDTMAFFVTAGNERGSSIDTSVFERSDVVLVTLSAGDTGSFSY